MTFASVAFGGTNEYYPNGGIPLSDGGFGFRSDTYAVVVLEDGASGYHYQWDRSANTIRMFVSADGTVDTELDDTSLASEITLEVMAVGW